ncbi:MAG: acyl-CoA dehydrogenase [Gammaproteobacteria bacterium]|nr:acyl-CoA dehydrogenase [Gammaproteobacteria bacterium]
MNTERMLLADSVSRLFADLEAGISARNDDSALKACWSEVDKLGLLQTLVSESVGGFGGSWLDAFEVFYRLGQFAVPLPVGEQVLARYLLGVADIDFLSGQVALGLCENVYLEKNIVSGAWNFTGNVHAKYWGNEPRFLLVAVSGLEGQCFVLLSASQATGICDEPNLAGEMCSNLQFFLAPVLELRFVEDACVLLHNAGALLRTAQIAGALEAILGLCVDHVQQREQFGKPIGTFQAIQHQLALLAEEAAAVKCAAQSAFRAASIGEAGFEVAAAKLRANRAITPATSIAHQVHGAIGFTMEHSLHRFTQRLWSWRSDFGNDRYWAEQLGKLVLMQGAEHLWSNLIQRGDNTNG